MKIRLNKIFQTLLAAFIIVAFIPIANAQSNEGALSFNPTSFNVTDAGTTSVAVVYTGTPITAAEVHVNLGTDLEIVSFDAGDLVVILSDEDNGEIHVGKLSDGDIESGSTLFTMEMRATACGGSGTISINESETLIPDVTVSSSTASYTANCGSGTTTGTTTSGTTTSGSSSGTSINQLPNTSVNAFENTYFKTVLALILIIIGVNLLFITKYAREELFFKK